MPQTSNKTIGLDADERPKQKRSRLRRMVGNATSVVSSDLVVRASSFVMYALVARYLGAFQLGQLSLSVSLFQIFLMISVAGTKAVTTREVARDRSKTDEYLVSGTILVLVFTLISMLILFIFVRLMNYAVDTSAVVLLMSIGLIPFALSQLLEGVFLGWEKMHFIAYANIPTSIARVSIIFLMLMQGYGIYHIVGVVVFSYVALLIVEWGLVLKYITRLRTGINLRSCWHMAGATTTFMAIQGTNTTKTNLTVILLSKLAGETEVGIYSAASQLMVPLKLFFNNIVASVYPAMCRKVEAGLQNLQHFSDNLIEFLMVVALPVVVGLFFLAEPVLLFLYDDPEFLKAALVLRIIVWMPLLNALTTVLGQVLWASRREKTALRIALANLVVKLILGVIMISQFDLIGAALVSVLVIVINFVQHYLPISKMFPQTGLLRLIWKPVVASTIMAGYLYLVREQGFILVVASAALVYAGVLIILFVWSAGGFNQLKTKYLFISQ